MSDYVSNNKVLAVHITGPYWAAFWVFYRKIMQMFGPFF